MTRHWRGPSKSALQEMRESPSGRGATKSAETQKALWPDRVFAAGLFLSKTFYAALLLRIGRAGRRCRRQGRRGGRRRHRAFLRRKLRLVGTLVGRARKEHEAGRQGDRHQDANHQSHALAAIVFVVAVV